jgi:hypothetical protein
MTNISWRQQIAEKMNYYANDGDMVMPNSSFTYVYVSNASIPKGL